MCSLKAQQKLAPLFLIDFRLWGCIRFPGMKDFTLASFLIKIDISAQFSLSAPAFYIFHGK